jgi:hypothetical protein
MFFFFYAFSCVSQQGHFKSTILKMEKKTMSKTLYKKVEGEKKILFSFDFLSHF